MRGTGLFTFRQEKCILRSVLSNAHPLQAIPAFRLTSPMIMPGCRSEDLKPCFARPPASRPFSLLRIRLSRNLFLFLRLLLNRPLPAHPGRPIAHRRVRLPQLPGYPPDAHPLLSH